ncbi:MAG: energy transducer TonB [Chitinivibrionia bacterium]|nr:energy transducer TonB [Chitinivibrionia bacterium]
MPERIAERDRLYRRKLLYISPISVFLILWLFITPGEVPLFETEKNLGWKGEMQVLPELSILPETDPFETSVDERRIRMMTSVDVNVLDETGEAEGNRKQEEQKSEDVLTVPLQDGMDMITTRPMHSDVPYSEDYIILKMVRPVYPAEELENGIEGEVLLEILVNEEGKVQDAWVLTLIGPKSFEESSLKAVKEFLFQPPRIDGKPMPMSIRFQINFKMI